MNHLKVKLGVGHCLLFVLVFSIKTLGQCPSLTGIIDSNSPMEVKQGKIDSLFTSLSQNDDFALAECYHILGNKWYFENWLKDENPESLENAIFFTKKASGIKSKLAVIDSVSLKQSLYNLGYFHNLKGSIYEAATSFKEIIRFNDNDEITLYAKKDIGKLYLETGDFHKAIAMFNEIIETCQNNPDRWEFLLETHILLADTYGTMDYLIHENTIYQHLQKADSIVKRNNMESSFEKNQVLLFEGNLLLRTGNYEDAISKYDKLLLNSDVFYPEELAAVYSNLGNCLFKNTEWERAEKELQRSVSLDQSHSNSYENLGDLFMKKKDFSQGMNYYNKAIHISMGKDKESDTEKEPSIEQLKLANNKLLMLNHLVAKANGWLVYYDHDGNKEHLASALKTFELADMVVDLIRFESTEFQSKLYWREQSSALYMKAVKACYLLFRPEKAFYFMERNKALLLLEDLSYEQAKDISNLPDELAQREFSLKRKIYLSENRLQENSTLVSSDSVSALKNAIRANKYHYEEFIDSLDKSYPDYAKFRKKVDVLTFENLKSDYISGSSTTLHYILNEEDGYGLLTASDTTLLFQLNNIKRINRDVENLITKLSDGFSNMDTFEKVSHTVFQQLIPLDVYAKIKGREVVIVPDYTLQRIPFETLVVDTSKLEYLLESVDIGYTYSISLLHNYKRTQRNQTIDFLGVAPVLFDDLKLPELYFSNKEIKEIATIYPGDTLLNLNASKTNFTNNLEDYKILHLATHADVGDGENPWVAFSDSKMYLKEIYATKNQADMVVLSACNTSNGTLKRGEGIMSLARGFFYSGAKSVVSTLWPVADESGKEILINFYKNLDRGSSKSRALQKAKLDYLNTTEEEELKHPYYWAGFVVLGDNAPVSEKHIPFWALLGIGFLGTGILVFGYKKIKAHQAVA